MPVLYDDGFQVVQSNAILRHLGRKYNLYGSNLQEAARLDFVNDGVEDVRGAYLKLPGTLANLEKLLSASAYVIGDGKVVSYVENDP